MVLTSTRACTQLAQSRDAELAGAAGRHSQPASDCLSGRKQGLFRRPAHGTPAPPAQQTDAWTLLRRAHRTLCVQARAASPALPCRCTLWREGRLHTTRRQVRTTADVDSSLGKAGMCAPWMLRKESKAGTPSMLQLRTHGQGVGGRLAPCCRMSPDSQPRTLRRARKQTRLRRTPRPGAQAPTPCDLPGSVAAVRARAGLLSR